MNYRNAGNLLQSGRGIVGMFLVTIKELSLFYLYEYSYDNA